MKQKKMIRHQHFTTVKLSESTDFSIVKMYEWIYLNTQKMIKKMNSIQELNRAIINTTNFFDNNECT